MDTLPSPGTAAAAASAAASTVTDLASVLAEQTASSRRTARALANQLLSAETFYENFLELLAQLTSLLLTDEETERIASSLKQFHATLQRVSSRSALAVTGSPLHAAWQPLPGGATPPGTPPGSAAYLDDPDFPPVPIPKALQCAHKGTCTQHCSRGFLRTLLVGYAIKYTVGTLPMLFSPAKIVARPSLLLREINKDTIQFAMFLSTFTTGYKALFCAFRRYFATRHEWWVGGADNVPKRLRKLAAFLAGALASMALLIDKNKGRRTAIALYFLTRAIEFGFKFAFTRWRKGWELRFGSTSSSKDAQVEVVDEQVKDSGIGDSPPDSTALAQRVSTDDLGSNNNDNGLHVLTPSQLLLKRAAAPVAPTTTEPSKPASRLTQLAHSAARRLPDFLASSAGVLVMSLSSSQILFSYVAMPDTLASSYMSFLLTHGGQRDRMGPLVAHALRTMGRIVWRTTGHPHLADVYCAMPDGAGSNTSTSPWMSPGKFAMCGMIHPDHDFCHRFAAQCFLTSFKRSAKLYAPLNLAMTLVLGHAKLRKRPLASLQRLIVSTIRSSLFLAGYVTTAWSATCTLRNALQREHIAFYLINGMLSGAWSMLEPPGRRLDLGLYCLPRALEAFWRALIAGGVLPTVPRTKEERARMGVVTRVAANVLTNKSVGEPLYFAIATGLLLSLYEGEQWVLSSGYKSIMVRFFGVN